MPKLRTSGCCTLNDEPRAQLRREGRERAVGASSRDASQDDAVVAAPRQQLVDAGGVAEARVGRLAAEAAGQEAVVRRVLAVLLEACSERRHPRGLGLRDRRGPRPAGRSGRSGCRGCSRAPASPPPRWSAAGSAAPRLRPGRLGLRPGRRGLGEQRRRDPQIEVRGWARTARKRTPASQEWSGRSAGPGPPGPATAAEKTDLLRIISGYSGLNPKTERLGQMFCRANPRPRPTVRSASRCRTWRVGAASRRMAPTR